eukprot:m.181310 g.181310  ORF g.181310 m.181310 type:complete len:76 (-) comp15514_c0_seq10:225-452(-)
MSSKERGDWDLENTLLLGLVDLMGASGGAPDRRGERLPVDVLRFKGYKESGVLLLEDMVDLRDLHWSQTLCEPLK